MPRKLKEEQILLAEMQVLLAEMRTHLSIVRTGAGMTVSTSTIGFLLFTNSGHFPDSFVSYAVYIYLVLAVLFLTGIFMFLRSERKIIAIGSLIKEAEKSNKRIDKIMV